MGTSNHQLWVLAITFVVLATIERDALCGVCFVGRVVPGVSAREAGVQYGGRLAAVDCWRVGVAGEAGDVLRHAAT